MNIGNNSNLRRLKAIYLNFNHKLNELTHPNDGVG